MIDPGEFSVHVFPTIAEEVAWNVGRFLLAWRIALATHVGSVEFGVGREKYLLRKGEDVENDVIYSFLEDQAVFLANGETFQWLSTMFKILVMTTFQNTSDQDPTLRITSCMPCTMSTIFQMRYGQRYGDIFTTSSIDIPETRDT